MQKLNPILHRMLFSSILQSNDESIQKYWIHLRSKSQDCNFICPNCNHDLSSLYIKYHFIQSIANDILQADKLVKAKSQKMLEQNVNHVEAFESAM